MKVVALCFDCAHKHVLDFDPHQGPGGAFGDWLTKHPQHDIHFQWPERSPKRPPMPSPYGPFLHNSDVKLAYAATVQPTMTLGALPASAGLLGGRESSAISNATNKYLDYLLAGHFLTLLANIQAGFIRVAVVGSRDDTPNWPDVFDGTDSPETVTTQGIYDSVCRIAAEIATDATARTWPFGPVSVESILGKIPVAFVLFVSHSTQTTTNVWATEANHAVRLTPVYATVI